MQAYCSEQASVNIKKVVRIQLTDTPGHYMYRRGSVSAQTTLNHEYLVYREKIVADEKRLYYFYNYPENEKLYRQLEDEYKAQPGNATEGEPTSTAPKSLLETLMNACWLLLFAQKES